MTEIKEKKDIAILEEDQLEGVNGGDGFNAMVEKRRYARAKTPTDKAQHAVKYCEEKGWEHVSKKYRCPACGSDNVFNYDPGWFRVIRVVCFNCGAFLCRDGDSNPWID